MGVGSKTLTEGLHGATAVGAGRDDKDLLSAENDWLYYCTEKHLEIKHIHALYIDSPEYARRSML